MRASAGRRTQRQAEHMDSEGIKSAFYPARRNLYIAPSPSTENTQPPKCSGYGYVGISVIQSKDKRLTPNAHGRNFHKSPKLSVST
jgi:hypothetical protein